MDNLKLENQICFPLYVCSKEIIRRYKPFLDEINLTYTQYIVMMVLWEEKEISFRDLSKRLYLESNTLTPVLNKLEDKGFIVKKKLENNDKNLNLTITKKGQKLKEKAKKIPEKMGKCAIIQESDFETLKEILERTMKLI